MKLNDLFLPNAASVLVLTALLCGCSASDSKSSSTSSITETSSSSSTESSSSSATDSSSNSSSDSSSSETTATNSLYPSIDLGDCASGNHMEEVVCAANALVDSLTADEQDTLFYDWSDSAAKTTWSNFPTFFKPRNGIQFADLDEDSQRAFAVVARAVLGDAGYQDFVGVRAADEYLSTIEPGNFGLGKYYIAFFGTPDVRGDFMIQIGGHHMAYNMTYLSGIGYPVPNHIAAEPKTSVEYDSASYAPMQDEGDAMVAMFEGLDNTQLSSAFLTGQTFGDVLMGPDEGSGVLPTSYPTGDDRGGILVSSLDADQQALVIAAIEQWVEDFPEGDSLMQEYTSDAALAETVIAWAGTESAGVDVDVEHTYMRIDGPRLWIELACQGGTTIAGQTHFHSMYRDKTMDYGNSLN